jgi:hypothetical protein
LVFYPNYGKIANKALLEDAMLARQILEEVITLPEGSVLAGKMGYALDRSNLLRYARSGRLVARKSQGAWLTTRAALQALIVELATETRGRPRPAPAPSLCSGQALGVTEGTPAWATAELAPDVAASLAEIDALRSELASQPHSPAERDRLRRELIVEAIYHTNRIEGNLLSLPEVRTVVEAFWAEGGERRSVLHEDKAAYEPASA